MPSKMDQLKTRLAEIQNLKNAASVLSWDMEVNMPSGGTEDRGEQLATLESLAHSKFTSDEIGQLLEDLEDRKNGEDPDSDAARLLQFLAREYARETRVPSEYVAEFAQATTRAREAWLRAKKAADFAIFQPSMEKIVELARRYAEFFAPYDHIYDPMLDRFEPGMKTVEVQAIFDEVRPQQVEILQAIAAQPQVDDSFLHQRFDEDGQWELGVEVITRYGYDWERGRLDRSAHPFTTSFGLGDVRITTRVMPDFFNPAFFATLHECGHALYDQGIDPDLGRTPLANGASLAIHESQSRMWENLVGRSRPFWEYFYPRAREIFPDQLGGVSVDAFYRGINRVEPSLIRVEADEATYNLHIMLRLELEIALLEGTLKVDDLPTAWNDRMEAYLGLIPPNDAEGVLQDIHWSSGLMGYFSTYALGNLISVQLWDRIQEEIPDLSDQIRAGEFQALLDWLRREIHTHGAKFPPQELVERVTGSRIDPAPYLKYLEGKFGEVYGI